MYLKESLQVNLILVVSNLKVSSVLDSLLHCTIEVELLSCLRTVTNSNNLTFYSCATSLRTINLMLVNLSASVSNSLWSDRACIKHSIIRLYRWSRTILEVSNELEYIRVTLVSCICAVIIVCITILLKVMAIVLTSVVNTHELSSSRSCNCSYQCSRKFIVVSITIVL